MSDITHQQDSKKMDGADDDHVPLPGFRFHPNDEEILGFYLRRKVEKKRLRIELIKEIDIYKYDPWDLPKPSCVGNNESYFFCKRGRKYRNSIRPNRVTGSGFWKATGIDKHVYSNGGEGNDCIGLKKTLVYYRGSAGKGTKTDWMMHEFRLPSNNDDNKNNNKISSEKSIQEAEVWTICRIFKRSFSQRKLFIPNQTREIEKKHSINPHQASSNKAYSMESSNGENYISFGLPATIDGYNQFDDQKSVVNYNHNNINGRSVQWHGDHTMSSSVTDHHLQPVSTVGSSCSTFSSDNRHQDQGEIINYENFFQYGNCWDELRSVVEFALHDDDPSFL